MYAQKNYPQKMGNGNFSIQETGCLLTAICNGLQRLNGTSPDPVTLNQFFNDHHLYGDAAPRDGWMDDLGWDSIVKYDPSITIAQIGVGAQLPSANAIVKFHYNGVHTGQPTDHFCWVDRIENGQIFIIDSWDGLVKAPSGYEGVYGKPVGFATYNKQTPQPTPPPAPAPVPVALPKGAMTADSPYYGKPIVRDIPGYMSATNAANHTNQVTTVKAANSYFLFTSKYGMDNVTLVSGQPGAWINPSDNVEVAAPAPATSPELYRIVADIPGYNTSNDAANHINRDRTVNTGAYFIFNQVHGMVNVTTKPGTPGAWINPSENIEPVPAPAPTPVVVTEPAVASAPLPAVPMPNTPNWRSSYHAFEKNRCYVALKATDVDDVAGERPRLTLKDGKGLKQFEQVWISGVFTFVSEDGTTIEYGRAANRAGNNYWYAIPLSVNGELQNIIEPYKITYDTTTTPAERRDMHTATMRDYIVLGQESLKHFLTVLKGLASKNKN